MSLYPLETDTYPPEKSVAGFGFAYARRTAIGVMCIFLVSGCKDTLDTSDPLTGRRAGEQRRFGLGHGTAIEFRWAPGGYFLMGSPEDEPGRNRDEKQRKVRIKEGFWIAEVETTVAVWQKVMGSAPDMKNTGDTMPVSYVSWHDCRDFLKRLQPPSYGWRYELPTEAQWEYACRAGGNSMSPRRITTMGWVDANSGGRSHPVGKKPANAWSLRDMHGNVAEWCRDAVGNHGSERAIRGGSWDSDISARAAARNSDTPFLKINRVGFRLVLVREQAPNAEVPAPSLVHH